MIYLRKMVSNLSVECYLTFVGMREKSGQNIKMRKPLTR